MPGEALRLWSYWRSTTSYRVRIALALKGLSYESVPVDLVAGAQKSDAFSALNPSQGVPMLEHGGLRLTQSMAILEYLDTTFPEPRLIPEDPVAAAQVRAAANVIACDIHPVNNLKVVARLKAMGHSQEEAIAWMCDWMARGFHAYQAMIPGGRYSFGDEITLADLCLVPQLYNAHRWGLDLAPYATLTDIEHTCLAHPAFAAAQPDQQDDATG
ncbi:maleylacetoacetate isomerase [Roseobacteraceae bacterium S113]